MKKCSIACLCSGTNGSTEHLWDYLAISDNELTLSAMLMYQYSPVSVEPVHAFLLCFPFKLLCYSPIPNTWNKDIPIPKTENTEPKIPHT